MKIKNSTNIMGKEETEKIKLIERFLDTENIDSTSLKSIKKIEILPLIAFKFLSKEDADLIWNLFKIETIKDLASLDQEKPFSKIKRNKKKQALINEIKKKDPEFKERLKKGITISLIIQRIKRKTVSEIVPDQKIIVLGLNNAGKTAILSKFGGQMGIETLASLQPTRGISRQEVRTKDINIHIWDFGGQVDHRNEYLASPDKYFFGLNLLIYVIDLQAPERYEESLKYFTQVIDEVLKLGESPHVLIFLHKFDPDIREDEEVLLNIEFIKDNIKELLKDKELNFEVHLSSIYSMISNEPEFSKLIKNTMTVHSNITDPNQLKLTELGNLVESAINAVIQLSTHVMEMEKRLETMEKRKRGRPTKKSESEGVPAPELSMLKPPSPPKGSTPPPKTQPPEGNVRMAIMSELKEMFVKKDLTKKAEM